MKLYEQYFLKLRYQRELFNGFHMALQASYAYRYHLDNSSLKPVIDRKNIDFTSNDPLLVEDPLYRMTNHHAAVLQIDLKYTPGQKYFSRPDQKIVISSKAPTFYFTYRKGLNVKGFSEANFDYMEGSLDYKLKIGLVGIMYAHAATGGFLNNARVELPDRASFKGNQMIFAQNYRDGFHILPYDLATTNQYFAQLHLEHHFNGFLFNKIPGFRKLKWQEVIGGHFLYTAAIRDYYEINAGIENIFKVFRVDFVAGFRRSTAPTYGVRAAIRLGFLD